MTPRRIGRDGILLLRFARTPERTILASSRFSHPLQVMSGMATPDGAAYVILLNPAGGVLGGDRLSTTITLEPNAHAFCTTASATKVLRGLGERSIIETKITLAQNSVLEYFPDHLILCSRASLLQSLHLEMQAQSVAILSDSFALGRIAHGEYLQFNEFDSLIKVRYEGEEIFFNRSKACPKLKPVDKLGATDGFNYVGGLIVFAPGNGRSQRLAWVMDKTLSEFPEVIGGVSVLAKEGCIARFLTRTAHDLNLLTRRLWAIARKQILGLDDFDPRKY